MVNVTVVVPEASDSVEIMIDAVYAKHLATLNYRSLLSDSGPTHR